MKHTLCLKIADNMEEAAFTAALVKLSGYKRKDGSVKQNSMIIGNSRALLRYRRTRFLPLKKTDKVLLATIEGVAFCNNKLLPIREIHLKYAHSELVQAQRLAEQIVEHFDAVLAEPDLQSRFEQGLGIYDFRTLLGYDAQKMTNILRYHLPWQLYLINSAWQQVLLKPTDKTALRQLRVKIRRFRSCLSFFKPVFKKAEIAVWQESFNADSELLGVLREADVALMACERIRAQAQAAEDTGLDVLQGLFERERTAAEQKLLAERTLTGVTKKLLAFQIWLQNQPLNVEYVNKNFVNFAQSRLDDWSTKLAARSAATEAGASMHELHILRIRIKRLRYAWQCLPELPLKLELLRKMKRLQDLLGFLHDDYINNDLLSRFVENEPDNKRLRYETGVFTGWERARAEASLSILPELWADFCETLALQRRK